MGWIKRLKEFFSDKSKFTNQPGTNFINQPETVDDIESLFTNKGLSSCFKQIKPFIREKIAIVTYPVDEAKLSIGQSKFGGRPDLINESIWPKTGEKKSMSFIAQINCADLSIQDPGIKLPANGLLSFFYCVNQEAWGFDPDDKTSFKVLFTRNNDLKRIDFPLDLDDHSKFVANRIEFKNALSLPNWEYDFMKDIITENDFDAYIDLSDINGNQMFGYANPVQALMELDCQLVTNGIYLGDPKGYDHPLAKELENGKNEWLLLLEVDSDYEKTGMMWGDSGKLYFWIKKQDLAELNFENCWCILQSY